MSTPHISCEKGSFAPTVIMPGDPLRSRHIAEHFLENAELVNDVRSIQGYTGYYKGRRVSVMASGMGGPSMGIYSHELYSFMGVETIIRVGTMGGMHPDMKLGDVVLAMGACTNSSFANQFGLKGTFAPIASYDLLRKADDAAKAMDINCKIGNVVTMDYFYNYSGDTCDWARLGVLGCEMETAILYTNAAYHGKKALAILTVSDLMSDMSGMTPDERTKSVDTMIKLALEL